MFSANENILLRKYKKQIVEWVEKTIDDVVLDLGVSVMVMQVMCTAPGCVPIETAIIIVFPTSTIELIPGLAESAGGSYKTKILKPMVDVTEQDVLESLPSYAFKGGLYTIEKVYIQARDVMLGQITQLISNENDIMGKKLFAQFLQQSLQDYIDNDCTPPVWGEHYPERTNNIKTTNTTTISDDETTTATTTNVVDDGKNDNPIISTTTDNEKELVVPSILPTSGNIVMKRPKDDDEKQCVTTTIASNPNGVGA